MTENDMRFLILCALMAASASAHAAEPEKSPHSAASNAPPLGSRDPRSPMFLKLEEGIGMPRSNFRRRRRR
jgi:hypothetical protein